MRSIRIHQLNFNCISLIRVHLFCKLPHLNKFPLK
uniref:Uncharacterized protein n=1 Tax=Anguilla anguilla TaxID=7936 RepID=A0A0E9T923_ANGAN